MEEVIFLIILVFGFYYLRDRNKRKSYEKMKPYGDIGEYKVAEVLEQLGNEFEVANNIVVGDSQIDHLVINEDKHIIFVIETKHWGGTITGKHNCKDWTQEYKGKVEVLNNPMLQNQRHCRAVRNRWVGYEVVNVIVFTCSKDFPRYKGVIGIDELLDYISVRVSV